MHLHQITKTQRARQLLQCASCRRLLAIAVGLALALWPGWAAAECSPLDSGGCVDGAMYSFWEGVAGFGWWLDRTLLMGAYQLDTLRWWLVEVAFTSAYAALTAAVSPFLAPIATSAVIIGCLLFLLLPITGRLAVINIRHVLLWVMLGPTLLTASGPLVVEVERVRSEVGATLYGVVNGLVPGAIFGAAASDMEAPQPLYPATSCGVMLQRRSGVGLRLDDLAAALVWADAEDIHCPEVGGPGRDIPDAFYDAAPGGAGYAVAMDVSMMPPGTPRSESVRGMQRGAIRVFVAVVPCALAVLDALIQLIFALCLVALWVSLPIGMLFVFFQQNAGTVTGLFRRLLNVLQVSWSTSVLTGMIVACLIAAAELRNAAAYTGFAIGGGALLIYLLRVAIDTFIGCLATLSATTAIVTGLSPADAAVSTAHGAGAFAGRVASAGAATLTGGAAAGLVAAAAYQQTGSQPYAMAAALGRVQPIATLGEAAAAVGMIESSGELASGLYAGSRSRQSLRMAVRQFRSDAQQTDEQGRTFRERAIERRISRELRMAISPDGASDSSPASADSESEPPPSRPSLAAGWEHLRDTWRASDSLPSQVQVGAPTVEVIGERLPKSPSLRVVRLDRRGHVRYIAASTIPEHAFQAPTHSISISRLLTLGYAVHQDAGQIAFWQLDDPYRASARPARSPNAQPRTISLLSQQALAEVRISLVRAGALTARGRAEDIQSANVSPAGPTETPVEAANAT